MAPLHLLMVTMTSGRRKVIITTEGAVEEGHVDEGEAVVATMEVGGAVADVVLGCWWCWGGGGRGVGLLWWR